MVSLTRLWGSVNPSGRLRAIQMSVVKKDFGIESGGSIPGMMDRGASQTVTCQCEDGGFLTCIC